MNLFTYFSCFEIIFLTTIERMGINSKLKITLLSVLALLLVTLFFYFVSESPSEIANQTVSRNREQLQQFRKIFSAQLSPDFLKNNFPVFKELQINGENKKVSLQYTLDPELQREAEKLLKSYKPDYGSVVILNAKTGQILTLASYQRQKRLPDNLAMLGSFPAASIFKIVTATAAIDKYHFQPNSKIQFNGGNHTLYKKNVMSGNVNRWTRSMTLKEAFSRSINTVFGRMVLENMQPSDLTEYAHRYGFNLNVNSDIAFETGTTQIPDEKNFELAAIASGFNKITQMSPIQGAMIAASVVQNGRMPVPYLIEKAMDEEGNLLFKAEPMVASITMSPESSARLQTLMEATITSGTSRKSFRSLLKDRKFRQIELGGKTGSLTGDHPKGKVDWFVGYATNEDSNLAIAAITVNVEKWTVKSSHLAQSLFRKHYGYQFSKESEDFFNASLE